MNSYSILGQIVFHHCLPHSTVSLKFTANVSRWVRSISVNVNLINSALHVAKQRQFFTSPLVQSFEMIRDNVISFD
jgi:hypothetical protein